jgi:flagellar biosynthesis/type III secretory pathway protein FliH
MPASWCWQEAAMALSDQNAQPAPWCASPLLNGKSQAPVFLRTQWDEAKAHAFGPWRVADRTEPTDALTLPEPVPGAKLSDDNAEPFGEPTTETPLPQQAEDTLVSESALTALRTAAYQQGLTDGQAQMREHLSAELDAERAKERELIRHLGIELRSISQDPQRFFEPLKRLSLHVAEQLVRAELQLSGQAVNGLIQGCIQQLDHPAQPVQVSLNPQDLQRVKALGQAATEHLQLEADAQLRPGSVRVRVQDTVVQDLIEHRLEPLARRLLAQPEAWMQSSGLVQDKVDALPENTPKRDWDRQVIDVQDSDIKTAQPDEDSPA